MPRPVQAMIDQVAVAFAEIYEDLVKTVGVNDNNRVLASTRGWAKFAIVAQLYAHTESAQRTRFKEATIPALKMSFRIATRPKNHRLTSIRCKGFR